MRKELRKLGRQLFVNPDNHDIRNNYVRKKKMFQKMVKHKKREIKQMIIDKLELLEENDPQRYWNLVDQLKNSENDSQINSVLTLDQWTNHYKELLVNPNHQNLNSTINSRIMKLKSQQIFNELSVGVKVSEVLMAVKAADDDAGKLQPVFLKRLYLLHICIFSFFLFNASLTTI